MGSIMGHELTHGFDMDGKFLFKYFDKTSQFSDVVVFSVIIRSHYIWSLVNQILYHLETSAQPVKPIRSILLTSSPKTELFSLR